MRVGSRRIDIRRSRALLSKTTSLSSRFKDGTERHETEQQSTDGRAQRFVRAQARNQTARTSDFLDARLDDCRLFVHGDFIRPEHPSTEAPHDVADVSPGPSPASVITYTHELICSPARFIVSSITHRPIR